MSSPNLDTNKWYSLYVNNDNSSSLLGTNLYNRAGTTGAIFFNKTDPEIATQRWQLYPANTTTYVLRCKASGANGFIGTQVADAAGIISPLMLRGDVADSSLFWQLGSWGDGTWYLWNGANGSGYHLAARSGGLVEMSGEVQAPQNGQRWGVEARAGIDDRAYSSVNLLSTTITTPSSTSTPPPSPGLSTAAKAGLSSVLVLTFSIVLTILALFYRRRRRRHRHHSKPMQKRSPRPQSVAYEPYKRETGPVLPERGAEHFKAELEHDGSVAKYEMSGHTVVELGGREQRKPVELPGQVGRG